MTRRRELEGHVFRRHLSVPSTRPSGAALHTASPLAATGAWQARPRASSASTVPNR